MSQTGIDVVGLFYAIISALANFGKDLYALAHEPEHREWLTTDRQTLQTKKEANLYEEEIVGKSSHAAGNRSNIGDPGGEG